MKERIGILGGSFDPVHNGHIALAEECLHQLKLDKVVFVPAHTSPFKRESGAASCEDRLQMLRLALKKEEGLELSTYEIDKGGVSYSVETVSHFRKTYGDEAELFFISGADSSKDLSEWKDIEKLLFLCITISEHGIDYMVILILFILFLIFPIMCLTLFMSILNNLLNIISVISFQSTRV